MFTYDSSQGLTDIAMAYTLLESLQNQYPDFGHWYVNKCMPGILVGEDKLLVVREHHRIIGVALGKKTPDEVKLRCVRVLLEYENKGIGIHLVEKMLKLLDKDKPACTVSQEMLHLFSRAFINHFNFELTRVSKGQYRPGKLEYLFNH
jgi:GNAT superfamily N-acetyltransferase